MPTRASDSLAIYDTMPLYIYYGISYWSPKKILIVKILKFALKFSVCTPITSALVLISSMFDWIN